MAVAVADGSTAVAMAAEVHGSIADRRLHRTHLGVVSPNPYMMLSPQRAMNWIASSTSSTMEQVAL